MKNAFIEFHDIARHRFDIGTNCELKVKLTPNDDRPAYSQSLPKTINLKKDATGELAPFTYLAILHFCPSPNTRVLFSHNENPMDALDYSWILGKLIT